jgi:hypothetical protein
MVCLHGFTDTWRTWELVLPVLERHNDVLAPTLPGHAGGLPLSGNAGVARLADAIEDAMDEAGLGLRTSSATPWAATSPCISLRAVEPRRWWHWPQPAGGPRATSRSKRRSTISPRCNHSLEAAAARGSDPGEHSSRRSLGRRADRERGHVGQVPQSTDPAERPIYGRLETYSWTEPKGGDDEHQGRNTAGA